MSYYSEEVRLKRKAWRDTPEQKAKTTVRAARYRAANRDKILEKARSKYTTDSRWKSKLKTAFKMSVEEYFRRLAEQKGVCAVCYKDSGDRRLCVDHDHACCPGDNSCGKCIRGLLCSNCNTALGMVNDDSAVLLRAIEYLNRKK